MKFQDMLRILLEKQRQWDSLTPEQQEAEKEKHVAYDERKLSESGYYDYEPDEDEND
ncbi:MAG: hypothetical protein BWZ11_01427 [Bacteroidetes bacterium ADurb.BinA395]|nr:MAG: hypothetical protein BWZ11_01427 [Bacteroidetes bacterium ADurb.BinA395]